MILILWRRRLGGAAPQPDKLTDVASPENIPAETCHPAARSEQFHASPPATAFRREGAHFPHRYHVVHFPRLSRHGAAAPNVHEDRPSDGGDVRVRQHATKI